MTSPGNDDRRNGGIRTAIVTGGASGIGRALAEALASSGVHVVLADRQVELAHAVAGGIRSRGGTADVADLDVSDGVGFQAVVTAAVAATGRIDFLFNNAGIGVVGEIRHYGPDDWRDVLDVNLLGVIHGIAAAYPLMVQQGFGHIVNTASLAGLIATPMIGSYTASKFAVVGLSRALRIEGQRHGVRVSVLCPGIIRTPIMEGGRYGRFNSDAEMLAGHAPHMRRLAMDPDVFARRALRSIGRNRAVIVEPAWARWAWRFDRIAPRLTERLLARLFRRLTR
jgi:NAD(P)-dependent dehydrogenase (short-subunit alcohol dehydrogenase family)